MASARRPRGKALMGGRVGAARSLAHVTPVRARLTAAAPGDAGALRSPGAPPGNVSISCRLFPAGARAQSGRAEPSRAAGSGPAPPQVGEVPAPAPAPRLRDPSPLTERRRRCAAAVGRGRRRRWRLPGASRAARCSPRARRPRGAGGRVPSAGREWAPPRKLCVIAPELDDTKFAVCRRGLWRTLRLLQIWGSGIRGGGHGGGCAVTCARTPGLHAIPARAAPCKRAAGARQESQKEPAGMPGISGSRFNARACG